MQKYESFKIPYALWEKIELVAKTIHDYVAQGSFLAENTQVRVIISIVQIL